MAEKLYPAFLIFGPPGSGKGTVGAKLAATTNFCHISSGDIFRGLSKTSPSGQLFFQYASAGKLVPDEVTIQVFTRYLGGLVDTNRFDPDKQVLLLDGIPRTTVQTGLIAAQIDVLKVIVLDIPNEDIIVQRLLNRAKIEGRKDDADESVIRNRLKEYQEKTAAVLGCYPEEKIIRIDGSRSADEVFHEALGAVLQARRAAN